MKMAVADNTEIAEALERTSIENKSDYITTGVPGFFELVDFYEKIANIPVDKKYKNVPDFFNFVEACDNDENVATLTASGLTLESSKALAAQINPDKPVHAALFLYEDLIDRINGKTDYEDFSVEDNKEALLLKEAEEKFGALIRFYAGNLNKKLPNELERLLKTEVRLQDSKESAELKENAKHLLLSKFYQRCTTPEACLDLLKIVTGLQAKVAGTSKYEQWQQLEDKVRAEHYLQQTPLHLKKDEGHAEEYEEIAKFIKDVSKVPALTLLQFDRRFVKKGRGFAVAPKDFKLYMLLPEWNPHKNTTAAEFSARNGYKNQMPIVAKASVPESLNDLMTAYLFYNCKDVDFTSEEEVKEAKNKELNERIAAFFNYAEGKTSKNKPKTEEDIIIYDSIRPEVHSVKFEKRFLGGGAGFFLYDSRGQTKKSKIGYYEVHPAKDGQYRIPIYQKRGRELRFNVYNCDGHKKDFSLQPLAIYQIAKELGYKSVEKLK